MQSLDLSLEGIGFWARGLPDWPSARALLRDGVPPRADAPARPAPGLLPPAERRRAPEPVLLACEAAAQACSAAARDPATLASVFASMHGDLGITDYLCATLAEAPHELSPIRFHNSVHNAPSGYWTIATGCHEPATSITAWHGSFGAGLLEAAVQAHAGGAPVLLAAYDGESSGPLAEVVPGAQPFAVAFVVAPATAETANLRLHPALALADAPLPALPSPAAALAAANATAAAALPLLHALAQGAPTRMRIDADASVLAVEVLA